MKIERKENAICYAGRENYETYAEIVGYIFLPFSSGQMKIRLMLTRRPVQL